MGVEIATLAEIRKARGISQKMLAQELGVSQPAISQIEHDTDMMLSRLRAHIESLGGTLSLVAHFPDRPAVEVSVGDIIAKADDGVAAAE